MKRVLVIDADDQGRFCLSVAGGALTIGASPTHAEVALRDLHIQRIHCEIEITEDSIVVSSPTAGSPADGPPVRREIRAGEELDTGHARLRLERAMEAEEAGPAMDETLPEVAEPTPAPAPLSGVRPTAAQPPSRLRKQLLVTDGADLKESFRLPFAGSVSIGNSGKHADICLHDFYVSRVHCLVETQEDKVFVTHGEGKNGTLINGERITQRQELRLGDVLRVGNSHMRLEVASDDAGATAALTPSKTVASQATMGQTGAAQTGGSQTAGGAGSAARITETRPQPWQGTKPQSDPSKNAEGEILGRYRLGPLLGPGHSGLVYRAQDVKTSQVVVLKVLAPEFPATSAELQQFAQALKAATLLQHPNLVSLFGAGKSGQHCWIAREHIEGESVEQLVGRLKEAGKPSWTRAVRVAVDLAEALAFLHEHKTVHGNITPRNVLVSSDKATKLADLMLARALAGSRLQRTTAEKKLLSELPYMAPEQVEPDAFVDHLADLYALGAVVYFLATGEPPFSGGSPEDMIANIRTAPVVRPTRYQRNIPFPFEGVLLKLLAKHQEDRYQTATDLLIDVYVLAHDHQIQV